MENVFLNADAICFDFDSTVIKYEGIYNHIKIYI